MFINLLLGSLLLAAGTVATPTVHLVVAKLHYEGQIYDLPVQAFDKKENADKLAAKIQRVYVVPCYISQVKIDKTGIDEYGAGYVVFRWKNGQFEFVHIFGDYDLAVKFATSNYEKDKSYGWYIDNVVYGDDIDLFPDTAQGKTLLTVNENLFSLSPKA